MRNCSWLVWSAVAIACGATAVAPAHAQQQPAPPAGLDLPFEPRDMYHIDDDPFPGREVTPVAEWVAFGAGEIPMVLIPGVGGDWSVFRDFMERNTALYRMYAITLPGFGGSAAPPIEMEDDFADLPYMRNAVAAIVEAIENSGLQKPILVGHGMGGQLAMWVALKRPDMARAVVSIEGYPIYHFSARNLDNDREARRYHVTNNLFGAINRESPREWEFRIDSSVRSMVIDPERGDQLKAMMLQCFRGTFVQAMFEYMLSDLREPMKTNTVPTLVIGAIPPEGETVFTPLQARQRMVELLGEPANTTLAVVSNSLHYVMDDQPGELDKLVRKFLFGEPIDGSSVSPTGTKRPVHPELADKPRQEQRPAPARP